MFENKSGFTLIELLVVIAIIGISVTLAVPSWNQANQKRGLTNAAEQVAAFLSVAQSEAQKRNQAVSLSFNRSDDQSWCIGTLVGSSGCDCRETDPGSAQYCSMDGQPSSIGATSFGYLKLIEATDGQPGDGDSYITFDPVRGILQPSGDKLNLTFESAGRSHQLRVHVSPTGLVKICNSDSNRTVGGYKACVM